MLDLAAEGGRIAFHDHGPTVEGFREALIAGLSKPQKAIPCRFLYDARGSALFDRICELPEYYPTRTETGILQARAAEMAALIGPRAQLIELGSGSSAKVRILLEALERPAAYVPIDISREHLRAAAEALAADFPALCVAAVCADYAQSFRLPEIAASGRRIAFFPGSTIGNLEPAEAKAFLAGWARRLGRGGAMLIGVDLKKEEAILNAAYDDSQGVTAAFSLNVLERANRELGADFAVDRFRHEARYEPDAGRVAIHVRSLTGQEVRVGGRTFRLGEGERIHIEHSYKYALGEFSELARQAGFEPERAWTDPKGLFSVHYLTTAT